ncbi:DnaJ-like protein DjlA [bacterium BMS3Abin09]|nr:DnaJ-like protein DjlA [bacterium BMS3Abin09]GBE40843.1 DnaJ-like protein DjlA [bacterium BMS3Bbin09]
MNYIWIILLAIYIISPRDAMPGIIDDILAAIALFYYLNKNSKAKQQQRSYDQSRQSRSNSYTPPPGPGGPLTIEEAYKKLGVDPGASMDKIGRAYKEKVRMSHPDKVTHLSEELQEKAKEITLELNEAYDLIKKYKKV